MYRPLPKEVETRKSSIHGLGLFATEYIPKNTILGITHVAHDLFPDGWIRTPLGGFINHSAKPNCIKYQPFVVAAPPIESGYEPPFYSIRTLRFIEKGEELTIFYTLYKIDE